MPWVKNLTAAAQVTVEAWVQSPVWHSGLKDLSGIGHICGLDSIPCLGTSICCECSHLKTNKQKRSREFSDFSQSHS